MTYYSRQKGSKEMKLPQKKDRKMRRGGELFMSILRIFIIDSLAGKESMMKQSMNFGTL